DGYDSTRIIKDMIGRNLDVMYPRRSGFSGAEILRVENLCVPHPTAYGKEIINDVSFTLNKGEILGLAGLVGSGRSETINAIFGSIPRKAGRIFMENEEVFIDSPMSAKKYGIGLLTEDRKKNGLVSTMSVCHNMTLTVLQKIRGSLLLNLDKEKEIAGEYFKKLKVKAPDLDTLVANLSGGNQQKVILSKWLITDLKVLLLDEPTRGIDVGTKSEIYRIINELADSGISIVMILSELPELLAVCDRFIVLGKGVVQAEMSREEATEVSILRASSNI
ncbi:MAG: D-xylose ABC transporter ATP-binding protein, partial [Spirochaetes bacterium]